MKLLKWTDVIVQALLIVFGITAACLYKGDALFWGYFAVGGWQLCSFFVHATVSKNYFFRNDRNSYGRTLLWVFFIGLFSLVGFLLFYLFALLIVSPFLAIWYLSICIREVALLNQKAFIHLK